MTSDQGPDANAGVRLSAWLVRALRLMMATSLFAMAALTFVDVIGRDLFSAPIPGTFESVGLLLGVVAFAALPLVTRSRGHITVDLFDNFIRGRFRRIRDLVVLAVSAATLAFLAERMFSAAYDEWQADYVTEYFGVSRAPLIFFLSALSLIACGFLCVMIRRHLRGGSGAEGSPRPPGGMGH